MQLSQVADLTGLDRRRLGYWVEKGYLVPRKRSPDRFDGRAVEKVLLLRQALAAGIPLRHALRLYEQFEDKPKRQPVHEEPGLASLRAQLGEARRALEMALQALEEPREIPLPGPTEESLVATRQ